MRKFIVYLGVLLILCGVSLICVDHVSANINDYYADVQMSTSIIENVNSNYSIFKEGAYNVKMSISEVADSLDCYYEDFVDVYEGLDLSVSKVKDDIASLTEVSRELNKNCAYDINNENMILQCKNFNINYLNMVKSYEKMLEEYNAYITSYNDFASKRDLDTIEVKEMKLDQDVYSIVLSIEGDSGE